VKRKIAFVGNHGLSRTLLPVSDKLKSYGISTFWIISGSREWADSIHNKCLPEHILDISKIYPYNDETLTELESFSEIKVSAIIQSDRLLSKKSRDYALSYICSVYSSAKEFILNNEIEFIFGEVTWAHELTIAAAAKSVGAKFFSPCNLRYPSDRFAFFEGVFQKRLIRQSGNIDISKGIKLLENFINEAPSPFYMKRERRPFHTLRSILKHTKRTLTWDKDETVAPIHNLIRDKLRLKHRNYDKVPKRYVYFPLHCQPEASIDVIAMFNNDQTNLIRSVSKALPHGTTLAVKEHPLGKPFKREKLPNVVYISPDIDSRQMIKGADMVVTISGTAAYEAGLLGIPAVVFTDIFFNELPTIKRCKSAEELTDIRFSEDNTRVKQAFLAKLYRDSYEGYFVSPDIHKDADKEENARNLSRAIVDFINNYSSSNSDIAASMCSRLI